MGSFALGAVRITGWCFAAVTAVFVWMITAGASRLKASKTLLRLAEAAEGFDCKKGLPLEAVDEKKARALKRVRRFIRNGWLSAWVDEKTEKLLSLIAFPFLLCGRWDLNPHDLSTTRSLV